jgi:phenylpropionate dioxygenase-like ring-hydroxylating dioxygenase large terminal subunit
MTPDQVAILRRLMAYEAARDEPPAGFPELPDIPGGRYTDERFFKLERDVLLQRSWLLAAHLDELGAPGDFLRWDNAGQPVVLVHTNDGAIRAFHNVCSHRGAPVVTEQSGNRRRLTCAYHGWGYSLAGELLAVRNPEDFRDLDRSRRGLKAIRCERYGKLIFVNFDPDAPSLQDWLGPIAEEWQEFRFDQCRLSTRAIFDINCNWKIALEANTEVYHVPSIHPRTIAPVLDPRRNVNTLYPYGHGRMVAPIPQPPDTGEAEHPTWQSRRREIESAGEIARTCTQSYNLFPNFVAPLNQYALPPLLIWPNGIDRCRIETWTMAPDWGSGDGPDMWTDNRGERLSQVLLEDTAMGEAVQASIQSPAFTGIPLSYQEARIYHWHQAADRLIGVDRVPPDLQVTQAIGQEWIHPNDPRLAGF